MKDKLGFRKKLEAIRSRAAVMLGFASTPEEAMETSQAVPKIVFVSDAQDYKTVTGRIIKKNEIDFVARIMSMGTLHKAYAVTGAVCTAGAAKIEGSVVSEMVKDISRENIRMGHPGGIIEVQPKIEKQGTSYYYAEAILGRTARRLMEGYVLVPEKYFKEENANNE